MTTTRRPFRRPGLTLTEALVATFVAAIGLISLMTLFPLGALQMMQAVKDERTGQLAMIADAKMRLAWRTNVIENYQDPFAAALDNPLYPQAADTTGKFPAPVGYEPSYPVFVDPIGWTARTNNPQSWLVDYYNPTSQPSPATVCLPRRTLFAFNSGPFGNTGIDTVPKAVQFCGLLDDLTYDDGGTAARPDPANANNYLNLERQGRFNWLAVVQRPSTASRGTADLTIVVFDGRAPGYGPVGVEPAFPAVPGAPVPASYANVQATFTPGSSSVSLSLGSPPNLAPRPAIKKGGWVMDATCTSGADKLRHAKFYRIVSVDDSTLDTTGSLNLDLQTPVTRSDGKSTAYTGTLVLLDGVSEVFRRPQLGSLQVPAQ